MKQHRILGLLACLCLAVFSTPAAAWWNGEWQYRRSIEVDVTKLALAEPAAGVNVPVRLHTGNFAFADAAEDGSDLRFVAGDDSTPLTFFVERYDRENEIALVWVRLPSVGGPTAKQNLWLYYGNPKATPASSSAAIYDVTSQLALHFSTAEAVPQDATVLQNHAVRSTAATTPGGVIGDALQFKADATVVLPRAPSLALPANGTFTFSAWLRLGARGEGLVLSHRQDDRALSVAVAGDQLVVRVDAGGRSIETPRTAALPLDSWHFVAVTADSKGLVVHIDGKETARSDAVLPALAGTVTLGAANGTPSFTGELDQLEFASVARTPAWIATAAALQTPDTTLVSYGEVSEGTGRGYGAIVRVIFRSVSPDGWLIVAIIAVLGVISFEVMLRKGRLLRRISSGDRVFLARFDKLPVEKLAVGATGEHTALGEGADQSALYRVFESGVQELNRVAALYSSRGRAFRISAEVAEVLKAGIEAEIVRQAARMNREMVLLTLSVSGAPFLGLLGTVVGIMMTFGAVTLMGDVNVNTIAPGVAAALITTVAGLTVAIPVMFGYNRLATEIRDLTTSMETFANDLLARISVANIE